MCIRDRDGVYLTELTATQQAKYIGWQGALDVYKRQVILREGGTMGDLYVDKGLRTDGNGNIWVDSQTGKVGVQDYAEPKKIGTMKMCIRDSNTSTRCRHSTSFPVTTILRRSVCSNDIAKAVE